MLRSMEVVTCGNGDVEVVIEGRDLLVWVNYILMNLKPIQEG